MFAVPVGSAAVDFGQRPCPRSPAWQARACVRIMYPLLRFCVSCAHHAFALYSSVVRSQSAFASSPCSSSSHRAVTHPVSNLVAPASQRRATYVRFPLLPPRPPWTHRFPVSFVVIYSSVIYYRGVVSFASEPSSQPSPLALLGRPRCWRLASNPQCASLLGPCLWRSPAVLLRPTSTIQSISRLPIASCLSPPNLGPSSSHHLSIPSADPTKSHRVLSSWDRRSNWPSRTCRVLIPIHYFPVSYTPL